MNGCIGYDWHSTPTPGRTWDENKESMSESRGTSSGWSILLGQWEKGRESM